MASIFVLAPLFENIVEFLGHGRHVLSFLVASHSILQIFGRELKTLTLRHSPCSDSTLLSSILSHCPELHSVYLGWCLSITHKGLISLQNFSCLYHLELSGCSQFSDDTMELVSTYLPKLQTIILDWCCQLSDNGFSCLSRLTQLRKVSVSRCNISDDVLASFAHIRGLLSIDCSCTEIGDEGIIALSNLTELQEIKCSRTQVTGRALHFLAKMTSLTKLDVSYCRLITDEGMEAFSYTNSKLECLNIRNCTLLSEQIETSLLRMCHLQNLDMRGCWKVSQIAMDRIAAGLPMLMDFNS